MNVDISNDSRRVTRLHAKLGKCHPVRVIWDSYQLVSFTVSRAQNRSQNRLRWFLDDNDIKCKPRFKNSIDNEVVLVNVI